MALSTADLEFLKRYVGDLLRIRADLRNATVPGPPPNPKYTSLATQLDIEILAALNRMTSLP